MKRVGKEGRVIDELSCGGTLREMTSDRADWAAEHEAGGCSGEGARGMSKGWVLVCPGRCVNGHRLTCFERVREALDAEAVRCEQKNVASRAAEQDADLRDGNGDEAGVGDLDAETGIPIAVEPRLDIDAQAGAVLGECAPRIQQAQHGAQGGDREREVFPGDPDGYRESNHGRNRSIDAGGTEGFVK